MWNAVRAIRPELPIPKRHTLSFLHRSRCCRSKIVLTVRNPLDIIVSMLGVSKLDPTPQAIDAKITELGHHGMDDALWLSKQPQVLTLRYEDFYGETNKLFDGLESFLGCTATPEVRKDFESRFSIEAVRQRADALRSFDRFDPQDQIHGRHISQQSGRPGYHTEILDDACATKISSRFTEFMETFGY